MSKATKINGKGKRPSEVNLKLEGRNAYGKRHVAFVCESNDVAYSILTLPLDSVKDFAADFKAAVDAAKNAADTTPAKYSKDDAKSDSRATSKASDGVQAKGKAIDDLDLGSVSPEVMETAAYLLQKLLAGAQGAPATPKKGKKAR